MSASGRQIVYAGTYTEEAEGARKPSDGIYMFEFDDSSGTLQARGSVQAVNPTYLAVSPDRRVLLATAELVEFAGSVGGGIGAYAIDPQNGALSFLNAQPTQGAHPCHISFDATGKWAFVANYSGGSVAALPVQADGSLGALATLIQHQPRGEGTERHGKPHAHSAVPDPNNRNVLIADLGLDEIGVYGLDADGAGLSGEKSAARTAPGAGPRHLTFHPNGRVVYACNELDSTVSAFAYDADSGTLNEMQTLSTLPEGYPGQRWVAAIHVDAAGRFLYVSNRGHDSIARFAIDAQSGRLTALGHTPTGGKTPRDFAIDLSGRWLLVANQESDSITTFAIDAASGDLKAAGQAVAVPQPAYLQFFALPA